MGVLNIVSEYRLRELCRDIARRHRGRLGGEEDLKASALGMLFTSLRRETGLVREPVFIAGVARSKSYQLAIDRILEDRVNYEYRDVIDDILLSPLAQT